MDTDGHRSEGVTKRPEIARRVKGLFRRNQYYNHASWRMFDKDLETRFFFLSPRRRGGERTEERGNPKPLGQTLLLSPALSSIRWRRGSGCGLPRRAKIIPIPNAEAG